jgi:hypothetical protein
MARNVEIKARVPDMVVKTCYTVCRRRPTH